jgi:hypothetical protein
MSLCNDQLAVNSVFSILSDTRDVFSIYVSFNIKLRRSDSHDDMTPHGQYKSPPSPRDFRHHHPQPEAFLEIEYAASLLKTITSLLSITITAEMPHQDEGEDFLLILSENGPRARTPVTVSPVLNQ